MSTNKRLAVALLSPGLFLVRVRCRLVAGFYFDLVQPLCVWLLAGSPEHRAQLKSP